MEKGYASLGCTLMYRHTKSLMLTPTSPRTTSCPAAESTSSLTAKVTGTIAGVEVPWSGADPNACQDLIKGDCPLEAGEETHYKASIPILAEYPPVSTSDDSRSFCNLII